MRQVSDTHVSMGEVGSSESHAYTKHKDRLPEKTVQKIRGILEEAGVETTVNWGDSEYEGAYSNRVSIPGSLMGTNGKGTTREFALASGYAEFMERLQNNILTTFRRISYANHDACGFYDQPDERMASAADVVARHQRGLDEIFSVLGYCDDDSRRAALENLALACYGRADGTLPEVPFADVTEGEVIWMPSAFVRQAYGSNGMASGNTLEECLVQGLSEIFERYVNHCIMKDDVTPPSIPRDYLAQWDVSDIIADIEESGRYRVHVYDCSMGGKYPVVMSLIADRIDATCGIKFGAHPSLPVAVERTLTEAFQGRNAASFTHINELSSDDEAVVDLWNLRSIMRDGSGLYPTRAFCGKPSWDFAPWGAAEGATNEEMLKGMLSILEREGRHLIVRDVSHLGFPSCHIIVPGFSELNEGTADIIEAELRWGARMDVLGHFPRLTDEEFQMLLELEPPVTAPNAQVIDMFSRPFVGGKMDCWRVYGFLRLSRGEFEKARDHFERFSRNMDEVGALYWRALAAYCDWRAKGETHEDALQLVGLLYPPAFQRRVARDTQDYEHMMETQFPQMNCDDCERCDMGAGGFCGGLVNKRAYAKILAALAKSNVRQEPLLERLAALESETTK
ncbi:MAG: YcaO-like family protein [Eggerthellaceae bacterium]|nr:YcaO-like family protein [Eggerthellaceae bacterium]